MCEYWTIATFVLFALIEAWFGKTSRTNAGSSLEFIYNLLVMGARRILKGNEHGG